MALKSWVGKAAVLFALLGAAAHAAQPMRFGRFGLDEGLAQLSANAIVQDRAGYLWIGTEEGLDRFDGYGFEHARHDRADARSLPNDFIGGMDVAADGALWIATDGGGVVRRDPVSGAFSTAVAQPGLERVRVVRFDGAGRLWIASRDAGVAMFEPRSGQLTRYQRLLSHESTFALLTDRRGAIWVGTQAGLDRIDSSSEAVAHHDGSLVRVRALLEDRHGGIWAGAASSLVQFDPITGHRVVYRPDSKRAGSLPSGQINALLEDAHGNVWIGTDGGLARLNRERGVFDLYRHDPADPTSLPDDQVMSLHEDRSGLLWIGTKFGGLAQWNPRTWSFGNHLASNVMAFTQDRAGRLWVGSIGGGLTREGKRVGGLSDDRVMALSTDRNGAIWAGTMGGGLNRIDAETLKVTVQQGLGVPGVMSLLEDAAGRLWVGTYDGGLARFERQTGQFAHYLPDPADPHKLSSGRVTALAQDRNGRIWTGTDGGGLSLLDPRTGEFFRLPHSTRDPAALSSDTVYAIHVDAAGGIWIGTRGGGLDQVLGSSLNPAAIRFRNYSERDGLPNNTVYGVRSDRNGMLWLSTNRGLARFDPRSGTARAFHRDHGLQGEEFNFGAHYANSDGQLLFGGPNGYNAFDPASLEFSATPPPVVLTSISRAGKTLLPPLRIDAREGAITFEFAALDFASPHANVFQYRLKGFDTHWSPPTPQRSVSYTNLDGGHYTLRVRAANADGVWNEAGFSIPLDVDPPAWKTSWAYAGYAAALALILGLAWLAHRRSIEREVRYSRELESEVRRRTLELEQVSLTDALTGLGNRRALIRAMPQVIADAQGRRMALLVIDLDNLKPINDEHGHEGGDRVLAGASAILRECLSEEDRVVRWGGDEFVIVKLNVDLAEAAALAERIRVRLEKQRFELAGRASTRSSCSIGFALYPFVPAAPAFLTWEQVLNLADIALYRAKEQRNAWVGWSGRPAAPGAADLTALLAAQMEPDCEEGYVESLSSNNITAADLLHKAI